MRGKPVVIDYRQIGQRLRAYREAKGLTAEETAAHLEISRSALYRVEAGYVVKIETLERLSGLLETSMGSLLGIDVEYHTSPISYFMRMGQLENEAEQIVAHFSPLSFLLMSDRYPTHLERMMMESLPDPADRQAREDVAKIMGILGARRRDAARRRLSIVNLISLPEIQQFLSLGLIGKFDLPDSERSQRRVAAQQEVEHLMRLMRDEPMGTQIGLIRDTLPNMTFEIFRCPTKTKLAVSPFRLGELPNIRFGLATVTEAAEPIAFYTALSERLWATACKGSQGAEVLAETLRSHGV